MSESAERAPTSVGRRWLSWLGALAAVAAVALVAWRVALRWDEVASRLGPRALLVVGLTAVGYAGACLLLSVGWSGLLSWHAGRLAPFGSVHRVYARTAIAKYLPGNVFHLAGRHALLRAAGFAHVTLALAAVHEVVSLLAMGSALALLGLGLSSAAADVVPGWVAVLFAALACLMPLALLPLRRVVPSLRRREAATVGVGERPLRRLVLAHGAHLAFFLVCGGLLLALASAAGGLQITRAAMPTLGLVLLAQAAAWTAGFVTPGAPGGLGVREAVLVALLAAPLGEGPALAVALAWRVATLGGEVLYFATSFVGREGGRPTEARVRPSGA